MRNKFCAAIYAWLLLASASFATLSVNTVFEVRDTGSDTNGGGFVTGAAGTDWSQQTSAQYSVVDGVTAGNSTITSATAAFGTDVVGNIIYVQGGTGSVTAGWFQITARNSATSITVDRATNPTLTAGTGVTLKIGGALATLSKAMSVWTQQNIIWVKNGSYSVGTSISPTSVNAIGNVRPNFVLGYNSTRGDNPTGSTRPTFTATAAIDIFAPLDHNLVVGHLIFDCNNTGNRCLNWTASSNADRGARVFYCSFRNFKTAGFYCAGAQAKGALVIGCDAIGGNSGATAGFLGMAEFFSCVARNNVCTGFDNAGIYANYIGCISASNTGSSSRGFSFDTYSLGNIMLDRCIAYGNGSDGIRCSAGTYQSFTVRNCILEANGASGTGYGINSGFTYPIANPVFDYNAFYNNATGTRNNLIAGPHDVTQTAGSYFSNASSGDFSLNSTTGRGALLRAAGYPAAFPLGLTTSYADIGPVQHQDAGGSSGGYSIFGGGIK